MAQCEMQPRRAGDLRATALATAKAIGSASDAQDAIDDIDDVPVTEVSAHPVYDHQAAIALAFQQQHLQELDLSEGLIKFLPHLLAGFLLIQLVLQPDLYLKRAQEYLESVFLLHVFYILQA